MRYLTCGLAGAVLVAALGAQSPLTTTYAGGNGLGGNTMMWFDLTLNTSVTITQLDINALAGSTAGGIDFYTIAGGHTGFETNQAAWTLQGSVAVATPNAAGTPTPCVFGAPFTLTPGTYGIAIGYTGGLGQAYTNGPLGPYSTAEMTLVQGGSGGLWGGIVNTPRVFNGSIYYTSGSGYATQVSYGAGCPARSSVAVFEQFAATTFDLANADLMFLPGALGSYTIISGPNQWFSGFTNNLALGDDACGTVTMPFAFPHAGGSTSTLSVSSNGFVWLGSNANSACCSGDSVTFLSDPMARIAACWMDLYPPGAPAGGGVFADFDAVSGDYVITWSQVPEYSASPAVNMQVALSPTGVFHIRYQTMTNTTHQALAGYSMGSASSSTLGSDLSTVVTAPIVTGGAAVPVALAASARPVIGTSINLVTSGIASGTAFGVNVLGFTQLNPGFDLTPIGAPGCFQYVSPIYTGLFLVGGPSSSSPLNIPNNPGLAGLHVYSQSLAFTAGYNTLGIVFSNGLNLGLDLL